MSQELTPDRLMTTAFAFGASKVLMTAVEFGLFTELAKGPKDLAQIIEKLKLHPRSAQDFLDTLVALKFIDRVNGKYVNLPEADAFLDRNKPGYIGGIFEMSNKRLFKFWDALPEALRTGKPQNEAKEDPKIFEKLYADPERLQSFLGAMTGISMGAARAISQLFEWRPYQTVADVGCAQGCVPVQLALAHPHLNAIGFDLPQVKPIFDAYVRQNELSDRVTFHAGDMFTQPLPKADVIVMGHILHDWGLAAKRSLVAKAYEALPKNGALIIYDAMIDNDRRESLGGLLMSLNMLIETSEGFDYTSNDCVAWVKEAGFKSVRVEKLPGPDSMVVAIK
jgi:precorrin-6B methylase 2